MQQFQLHFLDGYSGRLVHEERFEAVDDEQAIGIAERLRGLAPMELLCGDRLIRQWEAFPPP